MAANDQVITLVRNANKEPIGAEEAWQLVATVTSLVVASGKKVVEFVPATCDRQEMMAAIIGRSGKLRAPALQSGDQFFVGYNEEIVRLLTKK